MSRSTPRVGSFHRAAFGAVIIEQFLSIRKGTLSAPALNTPALNQQTIQQMIDQVKSTHAASPSRRDQLKELLFYLMTESSKERIQPLLDQIEPNMFKTLSFLVWKVYEKEERKYPNPNFGGREDPK